MEYRIDLDFCLDRRRQHREQRDPQQQGRDISGVVESGSGKSGSSSSPVPSTHHGEGDFDGAFSFSIVLTVSADSGSGFGSGRQADRVVAVGGTKEGEREVRCGSSVIAVQQQALKCLESTIVIHPIALS